MTDATPLASEQITADLEAIGKFVDDFLAPWGSWKTVWWEGEVSDDAAFSAENALKHVANKARRLAAAPKQAEQQGVEALQEVTLREAARDLLEARERLGYAVHDRVDLWRCLSAILEDAA